MGADDGAAANVDRRAVPCANLQVMDACAGGYDVHDCIDCANLVKVDVVDWYVVDLRFRVAEQFKDMDSSLLDGRGQRNSLDQCADLGKRAPVRMTVVVVLVVRVVVCVGVADLVFVLRLGLLCVRPLNLIGNLAAFEHIDLGAGDSTAVDFFDPEAGTEIERRGCVVEDVSWNSGVDQGPEKHVACDTGEAVKISNTHQ
jgi:hypothetical protein